MIIARAVFCLSTATTLFWILGFAAERVFGAEPPIWSYAIPAIVTAGVFAYVIFRSWPRFLTLSPGGTARFMRAIAIWTLLTYVIGVLAVGAVAYPLLNPSVQPSDAMWSEASLATYILALWFPLWFAPAIGLSVGWWQTSTPVRSNCTTEPQARKSGARTSL